MTGNSIVTQYETGFRANMNMAPQQMTSRLIGKVDADLNYTKEGELWNADDIGVSNPEDISTRVPDTPDKFLEFSRRVGSFRPFHDSAWLDNVDHARMLEDPTNKTMAALMAGRWRYADDKIIAAAVGNALVKEEDGTYTTTALPATQIIAADDVDYVHDDETAPTNGDDYGMGIGKIIKAGLLLDESEIDEVTDGERFLALSAKQIGDLLRSTPVTNSDYASVKALYDGKVNHLLGFTIVRTQRLLKTGNNRRCLAWLRPALVYNARPIVNASIRIRHDKSDNLQAYYKSEHGATRRYDNGVVEILAKEP